MLWIKSAVDRNHPEKREGRRCCEYSDQQLHAAADKPQPGAAMREAIADTPVQLHEAQESVRMDDNGVDIMEQSVELARNGYQLQYVMSAISGELSLLRTAIRG